MHYCTDWVADQLSTYLPNPECIRETEILSESIIYTLDKYFTIGFE